MGEYILKVTILRDGSPLLQHRDNDTDLGKIIERLEKLLKLYKLELSEK